MSGQTENQRRIIAVPSEAPGGLGAQRSAFFGCCDFFTLVKISEGTVTEVSVANNEPHHKGGCLDPVKLLASLGTTDIIVGGMGARPLASFGEMGITVYADQELSTVGEVVDALLLGRVPVMAALQS